MPGLRLVQSTLSVDASCRGDRGEAQRALVGVTMARQRKLRKVAVSAKIVESVWNVCDAHERLIANQGTLYLMVKMAVPHDLMLGYAAHLLQAHVDAQRQLNGLYKRLGLGVHVIPAENMGMHALKQRDDEAWLRRQLNGLSDSAPAS